MRVAPADLADRLGLSLASELVADQAPLTRETAVRAPAYAVTDDIAALLPQGKLSGQVAVPAQRLGATALLWRLLAGPSSAHLWCAVVGTDDLYPLAATAAGADLDRIAFVNPGAEQLSSAIGALLEGVPVIVASTRGLTPRQLQRTAARARRSGSTVIWREGATPVAGVDARLVPTRCEWIGLRPNTGRRWGAGRLHSCRIQVAATWRGRAGAVRAELWPYGTRPDQPD
jgi:hypothetical protein